MGPKKSSKQNCDNKLSRWADHRWTDGDYPADIFSPETPQMIDPLPLFLRTYPVLQELALPSDEMHDVALH